ncbi:hypothetical protein [Pedobacter ginsengisoli]|uniref:hypothetical protein n=1 Tax=Pedobacter ginsengisoli TaxID=363852 RepID=UPI00254DBC4A|nr:hypothetical protein [Pedobacter ginsengisoli]
MLSIVINLSILLILAVMSIQDFKYRAISWYAFPALAIFLIIANPGFSWAECLMNAGFIMVNYVLATVLISLKDCRMTNLMKAHIGPGDLLMLFCIAVYFPTLVFFLFYLLSLILIAIGAGIYMAWYKPQGYTVPLAGLQSAMLLMLILTAWITGLQISNTSWIENYLL